MFSSISSTIDEENPFSHLPDEFHPKRVARCTANCDDIILFTKNRGYLPKTDCGYWLAPAKLFVSSKSSYLDPVGLKGADILAPPTGWLHYWCYNKTGPSALLLNPTTWFWLCQFRTDEILPRMITELKKLWTPPQEIAQRKKECSDLFVIAKDAKTSRMPRCSKSKTAKT